MQLRLLLLLVAIVGGILSGCGGGGGSEDAAVSQLSDQGDAFATAVSATGGGGYSPAPDPGYSAPTSYATDYCSTGNYPTQWEWRDAVTQKQPLPATSGQPMVRHLRGGVLIATYNQLGGYRSSPNNVDGHDTSAGPFRRAPYTQWQAGDVFEVYPAVYEGENQQIYIGPNYKNDAAYNAGQADIPKNITIRGITVNGVRPVIKLPATGASNATFGQGLIYIDTSENIIIENMDVVSNDRGQGAVGKAAIYINGAKNVSLKNIRVDGFANRSVNGIFATSNNSGTLLLDGIELSNNGGGGGPEHNIYVNASSVDNRFTVKMTGSWSHDSFYGHLFKSRAQINILEGNYFQGSKASRPGDMRESWLVDIPEGGTLTARNNIFAKNASGDFTNGASITFGVERAVGTFDTSRAWALQIEHNTFVTFTRYFDSQSHAVYPLFINTAAPVLPANLRIRNNLFVGYCQTPSTVLGNPGYLGLDYLALDFNAIDQAFRPRVPVTARSSTIAGSLAYQHRQRTAQRRTAAIGAQD